VDFHKVLATSVKEDMVKKEEPREEEEVGADHVKDRNQ
jgi:hypothetical protein